MPVRVTIISTGEELVLGRTADGNAPFIASELGRHGFLVRRIVVVGDDPDALGEEVSRSLSDCRLVVISGGLGPTADDRTRSAIAAALGRDLTEDPDSRRHVVDRLHGFGREASPAQLSQALFPAGARVFPNPRGTARGFACEVGGAWVVAMPGVPDEMHAMLHNEVLPFLMEELRPEGCVRLETVHLFPASEAEVDERLADLTHPERNPAVGITVSDGVITVSLRAVGPDEEAVEELIRRDVRLLDGRFGDLVFGHGETTLARAVSDGLERTGRTIAVAESITGGLIGDMLVDVPGISRFFLADVVAYSNEAKVRQLRVPARLIEEHGAVSPQVAEAMARGTREIAGADVGLSTTGIAGPTGGTPEKPVGLVYVGLCLGTEAAVRELHLRGDRWRVKDRAARHALNLVRLAVQNGLESTA